MNAINASCHRKTNRRLDILYFNSSHSIHMINRLRTAAKNNYEPTYQKKLKDDIQNFIKLDRTILIDCLSPNSTCSCFKYLRSFSFNHIPNQMHWKHIKASTIIHIVNLLNFQFSSVYQTINATFLPKAGNPHVFLQDMTKQLSTTFDG